MLNFDWNLESTYFSYKLIIGFMILNLAFYLTIKTIANIRI